MSQRIIAFSVVVASLTTTTPLLASTFNINLIYDSSISASQIDVFDAAKKFWESVVTGYQNPLLSFPSLDITAQAILIDGVGGVLGQAGPTAGKEVGGKALPSAGIMQFDTDDIVGMENSGTFFDVILHEMAHVMGFGTLWAFNGVYDTDSGKYTGANALAAYNAEFDPLATFIPVELNYGEGTANYHWDTNWAGTSMELMTGILHSPAFVSNTTVASFADLGYTVTLLTTPAAPPAVPLPAGGLLLISAIGTLTLGKKLRKSLKKTES